MRHICVAAVAFSETYLVAASNGSGLWGRRLLCLDEDYCYLLEELAELGTPARLLEVVRLGHLWPV